MKDPYAGLTLPESLRRLRDRYITKPGTTAMLTRAAQALDRVTTAPPEGRTASGSVDWQVPPNYLHPETPPDMLGKIEIGDYLDAICQAFEDGAGEVVLIMGDREVGRIDRPAQCLAERARDAIAAEARRHAAAMGSEVA